MTSPIAGRVLPLQQAEELLWTLPSVVSARIIAGESGGAAEIHVLTTGEIPSKQMVRNIESALIAHFSLKVDHRKISVAVTNDPQQRPLQSVGGSKRTPPPSGVSRLARSDASEDVPTTRRKLYFEDIEVQASRSKGVTCRVTLRKDDGTLVTGESVGHESDRTRLELAARATLEAIAAFEGRSRQLVLDGLKELSAFEREYIFVGVLVRSGRDSRHFTGSCEVRDSGETASVLAVLDAMNRWIGS